MYRERIMELSKAIEQADDSSDIDIVIEALKQFSLYVSMVVSQESLLLRARLCREAVDFREYAMELDKSRKATHDSCLIYINMLNKLCTVYGTAPFCPSAHSMSRVELAEQVIKVTVDEYFERRGV